MKNGSAEKLSLEGILNIEQFWTKTIELNGDHCEKYNTHVKMFFCSRPGTYHLSLASMEYL